MNCVSLALLYAMDLNLYHWGQYILIETLYITYIYAHTFRSIKHYEPRKISFPTQVYRSDIRGSWVSIPVANFIGFSEK